MIAYKTLQFYTYVTRVLLDDMSAIIRSSNGSSTWRYLVTYKEITKYRNTQTGFNISSSLK